MHREIQHMIEYDDLILIGEQQGTIEGVRKKDLLTVFTFTINPDCDIWQLYRTPSKFNEVVAATTNGILFVNLEKNEENETTYELNTTHPLFDNYNARGVVEVIPN